MDEQTVMTVMETMAQMFETLVARIEATERRLDEAHKCSCQAWREHVRDKEDND